jgi:hypothetical protein
LHTQGLGLMPIVTEWVREKIKMKCEEMNREANKIGRRVCDVIADGDVLDRGLGLWNVPLFQVLGLSTPLALEQRANGQVRMAFPDPCSCITWSQIGLDPMAPVVWESLLS